VHVSGLPGYEFVTWFALLAPAKTPRGVIAPKRLFWRATWHRLTPGTNPSQDKGGQKP
jgi:hypothetical protein